MKIKLLLFLLLIPNIASAACRTGYFPTIEANTTLKYVTCDLESELPSSGYNSGDLLYAIDSNKLFSAASSTIHSTITPKPSAANMMGISTSTSNWGWNDFTAVATALESSIEGVVDLPQLQGAVTDAQVPDNITITNLSGTNTGDQTTVSGNAGTATALAANGGNCSGNEFALGVSASGVGECAQPAFSNLSGAATDAQVPNNITITGTGGDTAEQLLSGSGNYIPNANLSFAQVFLTGGGGAGATCTNTDSASGGGGAGGTSIKVWSAIGIGTQQPYIVGGGGATNASGTNSTFSNGGTLMTANGGSVGIGTTWISGSYYAQGGSGGSASGGTFNIAGGDGSFGEIQTTVVGMGGRGGESFWGGGAKGGLADAVGSAGVALGSGGGGCTAPSATDRNSGAGANGTLYIIEHLKD